METASRLTRAPYRAQAERWPKAGRVILAQYDEESVVVYQAFHRVTAEFAVEHQRLGGPRYSLSRMSWIKPNFLWMMYRCGWLTKDAEQARVLAIWIRRPFFDELLESAVPSTWDRSRYDTELAWKRAVKSSHVRLQWDPDHSPRGGSLARRAVQLGLRGPALRRFVEDETIAIEDISAMVEEQREFRAQDADLRTPAELEYPIPSEAAHQALGLE